MTTDDFEKIGIGLADARLLIVKYQTERKSDELQKLVSAVRTGSKKKSIASCKTQKEREINVEFVWRHSVRKKKFSTVKLSDGGGVRKRKFGLNVILKEVFDHAKSLYFPNGKSRKYGSTSVYNIKFYGADGKEITDFQSTLEHYMQENSFKICKFVLKTEKFVFPAFNWENSSDSDSDFLESPSMIPKQSTPLVTQCEDSIPGTSSLSEHIKQRRLLIQQQDVNFHKSLEADKEKQHMTIERDRLEEKRKKHESYIKLEPSLNEECILVAVNHISDGRVQRFFLVTDLFESVYHWIGSFVKTPEYFSLCFDFAGNTISPNSSVTVADRRVVMMNTETAEVVELFDSHITVNDDSTELPKTPEIRTSSSSNLPSETLQTLRCPVCGIAQDPRIIEAHAAACADQTFIQVLESDSDSDTEMPSIIDSSEKKPTEITYSDVCSSLKTILTQKTAVDTSMGVSLKVRRNHCFTDFCNRVKLAWVRQKIGSLFVVSFYGETGIDQGGLRREFFSGLLHIYTYIYIYIYLFIYFVCFFNLKTASTIHAVNVN